MTTLATINVIRNLFNQGPAHKAGLRIQAMNALKAKDAKAFMNACTEAGIDSLDALSTACVLFPAFKAEIKAQKAAAKAAVEAKAKASKEAIANALPKAIQELKALVPVKQRKPRCFKKKVEVVVEPTIEVVAPVVQAQAFEPEPVAATKVVAPVVNAGALATVAVAVGLGPIAPAIAFAGAAGTAMLGEEKGAIAAAAVVAVGGVSALVGGGVIGILGAVALAPVATVVVIGGVLSTIRRS
jgi:hypothetical protein